MTDGRLLLLLKRPGCPERPSTSGCAGFVKRGRARGPHITTTPLTAAPERGHRAADPACSASAPVGATPAVLPVLASCCTSTSNILAGPLTGGGWRVHGRQGNHNTNQGWDKLHMVIDDHTRMAFVQVHDNERGDTCAAFLNDAVAWFATHGSRSRP